MDTITLITALILDPGQCETFDPTSPIAYECDVVLEAMDTPCRHEDSALCTWDAAIQGNGHGVSFTAVPVYMDGDVFDVVVYEDGAVRIYEVE